MDALHPALHTRALFWFCIYRLKIESYRYTVRHKTQENSDPSYEYVVTLHMDLIYAIWI